MTQLNKSPTGMDATGPVVAVEWRPALDFEDFFEVSSAGQVRSLKTGRIIAIRQLPAGYQVCTLHDNVKHYTRLIHRLVAEVFCDGYKKELVVNHKDGVKTNNHFSNLEWTTTQGNIQHARATGLMVNHGEVSNFAKLTVEKVKLIKQELAAGDSLTTIAKRHGTTFQNISCIKRGKSWKRVT